MQNFTRYSDAYVNKFFKYNLLCLLNLYNRYWNQVHTKLENLFSISLVSTEISHRRNTVRSSRGIYLSVYSIYIFNFKVLFICVKDTACLKVAKPAYCFNIFGSYFGAFFCLLIEKLILGSKSIWESWRKFSFAVWSVRTFPHLDEEKHFFLEKFTLVRSSHWY